MCPRSLDAKPFSRNETLVLDFGYNNAVLLYLLIQRASRNPKPLCRTFDVSALLTQHAVNVDPLELQQGETVSIFRLKSLSVALESKILRLEHFPVTQQHGALEHITKLSDITRPVISLYGGFGLLREAKFPAS